MRKNLLVAAGVFISLVVVVPSVAGYLVFYELSKQKNVVLSGKYIPVFFMSSFYIEEARLDWEDKVRLNTDKIKMDYDLMNFVMGRGIRVKISAKNLPVTLKGDFLGLAPSDKLIFSDFFADLSFKGSQLSDIHKLKAVSPEVKFEFGETGAKGIS